MTKTLCRRFYRGQCKKGNQCNFFHPKKITKNVTKEYNRESGHCYCGAVQKTIPNNHRKDDEDPYFYVICSRTGRSMRRCK